MKILYFQSRFEQSTRIYAYKQLSITVFLIYIILLSEIAIPVKRLRAESSIVVSVALSRRVDLAISQPILEKFKAAYPNIELRFVAPEEQLPAASDGIASYLQSLDALAQSADVVEIDSSVFSEEATQSGRFLDLMPLIQTDPTLNAKDFYPAMWQSFQWENGFWALPTIADLGLLVYDPQAFDQAGLPYPTPNWTIDDLANAARKLVQRDAAGTIVRSGIDTTSRFLEESLFRSLAADDFFSTEAIPNSPKLNSITTAHLLETWFNLQKEGVASRGSDSSALSISDPLVLGTQSNASSQWRGALLPGGRAALDLRGLALSAGTQHPDAAYAVAKFLSSAALFPITSTSIPARKSPNGLPDAVRDTFKNQPEVLDLISEAVQKAVSTAEMRYTAYLSVALRKMTTQKLSAPAALQAAELDVLAALRTASDKKQNSPVIVSTPAPATASQTSLRLGLSYKFQGNFSNKSLWDKLFADFY